MKMGSGVFGRLVLMSSSPYPVSAQTRLEETPLVHSLLAYSVINPNGYVSTGSLFLFLECSPSNRRGRVKEKRGGFESL